MSDADSSGGVRDCEELNNDFDQVLQLIPPPYPAQPTAAERQRKGVEQLMFTKETNLMKLTTSCGLQRAARFRSICYSLSNIVSARKFAQIKNQGERQPSSSMLETRQPAAVRCQKGLCASRTRFPSSNGAVVHCHAKFLMRPGLLRSTVPVPMVCERIYYPFRCLAWKCRASSVLRASSGLEILPNLLRNCV